MKLFQNLSVVVLLVLTPALMAQQQDAPPAADRAAETEPEAPASSSFQSGDWLSWPKMSGNWGGLRDQLADQGMTFDLDVTQAFQNNAHGGRRTTNGARYSGTTDLTLNFNMEKMGLWKGGNLMLHGEGDWGEGINRKVGSLSPANLDPVFLGDGEGAQMTLSEWIYSQVLFEGKLILIGGKLWGARAFETNAFANNEQTQFMNASLRNNPMIAPFLPYTNLGVGAIVNPTPWLSVLTAAADTEGRAKTTGFETTFHGPTHTSVIHEWAFKLKPFEKDGNYRVGFVWSSMEFPHHQPVSPFKQGGPLMAKLLGLETAGKVAKLLPTNTSPDNVMLYTNFDQYIYTEADDPTQGIGVFGRFGWARADVNPVNYFYSIGLGGKGLVPTRDNDTCGIGYYYLDLSNQLPSPFHSEQGVESYYNIELTPWLHLTPDMQVIVNPGGTDENDVSLVWGLRLHMSI